MRQPRSMANNDASFQGHSVYFSAMVFETLGAVNDEGEEVLRQLFRFAAKRLGREFTSYCAEPGSSVVQSATVCFASYSESH